MAIITIKIKVNNNAERLDGCDNIYDSLHEALCMAIHEGDEDALNWLQNNVEDINN